jgi:pimeloyl-ACP methyl ester carboxylesterase
LKPLRAQRDGVAIGYTEQGRGLAVVLVHGFANDRTLWQPQIAALAARYRIVAPDLRGFGGSSATDGRAVSMDEYADDIVMLLDHLGIPSAVVGGISLGGYVALAFALRHPQRLRGLVLANTRAGADPPDCAPLRAEMVRTVQARGAEAVVESYGDKPFRAHCPEPIKARVRDAIRRQPVPGLVSGTLGMAQRPDRTAMLASIRVPTLVIHGTGDQFIPVSEAEAMHRAIAGSRYACLQGAGHLSSIDSAEAFNAELDEFLRPLARDALP